jgi:tol-pal system protein YbgF
MRTVLGKWLTTCGLVIVTGPLCFPVLAQYVDLEAERAAAAAAGRDPADAAPAAAPPADPYGAQPAQAYPATSYGVDTAPPATGVTPTSTAGATAAPPTPSRTAQAGSELGNMYLQMQQLQQEVMRLNGMVEELSHEVNTLREQNLQRYMDLDKRLGSGQPAAGGATTAGAAATAPAAATPPPAPASSSPGVAQPGEEQAYRASYALVQGRKFEQAITSFKQFLQSYPGGQYAANAHYWLGELYLVLDPPDLESARQSFALLLSQYPQNSKAPDALYKLGKVQFLKGNREKAREYLDLVIAQYQGTNDAVVKLAQDFIDQNY